MAARPNDRWQADHTELDVMVLGEAGEPTRPWTAILDDHSRAAAGYMVFLGDPNTAQTSLALRQAIWRKQDPEGRVQGCHGQEASRGRLGDGEQPVVAPGA
ncbi:MAG: hypothetical protein ACR2P2_03035 [Nakamurella sp.]